MKKYSACLISSVLAVVLSACTNIGPQTIPRDRFDYNAAISGSWKEQTLLNIVKLRYADMPLFVDVASVVSGYSLESNVSIGAEATSDGGIRGDIASAGGSAKFTDRPTITYAPITGSQFNKSFMTPIPPAAILFLIQSGWPADMIFPLTVDSVNGLRSQVNRTDGVRAGDTGYYEVLKTLRQIQKSGATGMQVKTDDDTGDTALLIVHKAALSPADAASVDEFRSLLRISSETDEFEFRYGFLPVNDTEIAVVTRSLLQIMAYLAGQLDVPASHVDSGRTIASNANATPEAFDYRINIRHSEGEPENAFVSIRYHDNWYYIDDRDFLSKRQFSFVMLLMSLMESGSNAGLPLVTIPAG